MYRIWCGRGRERERGGENGLCIGDGEGEAEKGSDERRIDYVEEMVKESERPKKMRSGDVEER